MKKLFASLLASSLMLGAGNLYAEGPELNFKPEDSEKAEKQKPVYGDKPLVKVGNENNYLKLGGYGSIRFEYGSGQDLNETFTFRRFVLTTDARIASRFHINAELEFERFRKIELERTTKPTPGGGVALTQEIEGTNQSEIAIEQAWFQVDFKKWLNFKGGAVLVPLGRFNINHDDNRWNLPRRSLVDRGVPVLPTTSAWNELGFGLNGEFELGEKSKLSYEIYVVNGAVLDIALEQKLETRRLDTTKKEFEGELGLSTGSFSHDVKNTKTVTGRIAYSPMLGHEFGVSGYWGRYTPQYLVGKNLTAFGFDTLHTFKNFDIEAQYIYSHLGGLREVMDSFGRAVLNNVTEVEIDGVPGLETEVAFKPSRLASTKQGYWLELRYHFRPQWLTDSWFGRNFSDPQLIPVLRFEQAFIKNQITDLKIQNGAVTQFGTKNARVDRLTAGLAFRLNPLAVFHLAYEYTQTNKGTSLAEVVNYLDTPSSRSHGVMFGAAFGF